MSTHSYRRKMQRGFIHVLLLVFAVLGLTMWGASELQHWAEEKQQNIIKTSGENLISAREALFNYALLPPERIEFNNDANQYNAYTMLSGVPDRRIPFRYFALPCPDVAVGGDTNLDGVSDVLQTNCGEDGFESALQAGSRFGRLPWRDEKTETTGNFNYVRGLGNIDFRDGYNQRLWYAVSPNLIDVIDITDPAFDRPLNPHYLLRLTTGWLSAYEESNGDLLSNRVAAAVITPGASGAGNTGARISEERLYAGPGTTPAVVNTQLVGAYLEPADNYADFFTAGGSGLSLTVRGDVDTASADRTEYLTIEELAADGSEGIAVLENSAQNIYNTIDGDGEFLNIVDLMSQHLERYGFLPDPAIYDAGIATQYSRPDGPAAQTTVTASYTYTAMVGSPPMPTQTTEMRELPFQQGLRMSASAVQSLEVRIADLPPVYLADGTILTLAPRRGELFPPYGSALARLESDLNAVPLSATPAGKVALDMVLRGPEGNRMSTHYPEEGLGGLQSTALISIHFSPPDLVPPISVVQAVNTILTPVPPFTVILADGAYGYFLGDTLISIVAYPNGKSPADIAALPPHAAKAYIPPGTRITIGTSNDVSVQIPHLPALPPGSAFDPDTGAWTIGPGLEIPVRLMAGNDQYLTIAAMPNNFPVVVGDSGFLPTEEAVVVDDMEGITISLSDQTNAISRLALPTRFHVDMSLLLQPFPPPGRPLAGGYEAQADAQPLATPYHLQPGTQFTVPAGSRIIYQPGVTFTTGDSFSFPANSILQIAPGAVVEVELLSASVLPGGISLTNTAGEVMLITLFHGGFVNIEDARMNFSDSNFLSSAQELFDIELRADALMLLAAPPHTALSGNEVIRPFINRRYTPQAAITLANAVFSSDSYVRAEFITRPRYLRLPGDDGAGDPSGMATDKAVASSYNQPREITLSDLRGLQGLGATVELEHNGLTDITVSITFDEDSEFFIPPNTPITLALSAFVQSLHIDGSRTTDNMRSVVLPAGTGFYDRDTNPPLSELTLALPPASPPTPMYPNLVVMNSPLTLTLAELAGADIIARGAGPRSEGLLENRLLLYPESDMYVHTDAGGGVTVVSLVAAGSVVDLLEGVIYAPVGMQRIKRVAEDLSIRSSDIAYIYNSKAVTLSIGKPTIRFEDTGTTVQVAPPPPSPITVLQAYYHSFSDYVDTPGSDINSEALTLVSDIVLPANSYIQLPPGQDIDFLSNNVGSTGSNPLDIPLADYAHLPPGAVAVIPHGASATATYQEIDNTSSPPMTMALATIIHGPAYLNLNDGRGGAAAFINSPAYLQTSPLVFLTGEARLFDLSSAPLVTDGVYSQPAAVTNRIYSYIPPNVRLDLHGNMERRIDSGFHTDLLPASSRQFYQDFPLIYAVAPECRRSARLHGSDCAQGEGEGLEFDLEAGEEYILRAPMEIPAAALITSAYPNIPLNVQVMDIGSDVVRETNSGILAILIDSTGMVTFTGGTYTPQLNDKIVVSIDALNHHTELRTYMSVGLALNSVLDDVSYVAVDDQALTIYSGGYVGDNYRNAAGVSTIQMNEPLAYGYGADLNLVTPGDKVFGAESMATVMFPRGGGVSYNTEINLADYTYAGPGTSIPSEAFIVSVTLSADTYDLDNNNYLYFSANAGSVLMAQGNSLDIDGVISLNSPTEIITVTAGTAIPMRSGYLWQGYMPRDADWALGQNVTMVSVYKRELYDHGVATNDPATITLASLMDNRLHLRIQSTVAELNLWGSGLERPESLDAESFTFEQQPIMPIIDGGPGVGRTGSGTPYYSYGAGRHIRHQERSRIYEDGYLEGLVAPDRPDTSRPGTPARPAHRAWRVW